jgi:hypothetical protein
MPFVTTQDGTETSSPVAQRRSPAMDLKLEVVIVPVTDVDKAMWFYVEGLGLWE